MQLFALIFADENKMALSTQKAFAKRRGEVPAFAYFECCVKKMQIVFQKYTYSGTILQFEKGRCDLAVGT